MGEGTVRGMCTSCSGVCLVDMMVGGYLESGMVAAFGDCYEVGFTQRWALLCKGRK